MVKFEVEDSWEAVCIPPGIYDAKISSILPKEIEKDGQPVQILEWTVEIVIEGEEILLTDSSSQRFTPKSKAFGWFVAASGVTPSVKDQVDLDTIADKLVQVVVKNETKTGFDGKKIEVSRISDIVAAKK